MAAGYERRSILKLVELERCSEFGFCPNMYVLSYAGDGKVGDSGVPLFYHNEEEGYQVVGLHEVSKDDEGGPICYTKLSENSAFLEKYLQVIPVCSHGSDSESGSGSDSGSGSGSASLLEPGIFTGVRGISKNIDDWYETRPKPKPPTTPETSPTSETLPTSETAPTSGISPTSESSDISETSATSAALVVSMPADLLMMLACFLVYDYSFSDN